MPADWAGPARKPAPRYRPSACRRSSRTGPSPDGARTDRAARPAMERDRRQRSPRARREQRGTDGSSPSRRRIAKTMRSGYRSSSSAGSARGSNDPEPVGIGVTSGTRSPEASPGIDSVTACVRPGFAGAWRAIISAARARLAGVAQYREQCRTAAHLVRKERSIRPRDTGLNQLLDRITAVRQSRDQGYRPPRNGGGPQLVAQTQRLRAVVEQRDDRLLARHPQRSPPACG